MRRSILWVAALLLLIAGGTALLTVEVPYTCEVPGKIAPIREWSLIGGVDDRLVSALRDNRTGHVQAFSVHTFARGDYLTFELNPRLQGKGRVAAGDTVGWLLSDELARQLASLESDLATAAASLKAEQAGQKEAIVRQARQRLAHAEAQKTHQQKRLERQRALFATGLSPAEELEETENLLELFRIQQEIASAELQAVRTGAEEERIELARVQLAGLQKELDVLHRRARARALVSPLAGVISSPLSADTLLTVRDTTAHVARLVVAWQDRELAAFGRPVYLQVAGRDAPIEGTILLQEDRVRLLNGRQVVIAVARFDDHAGELAPGLLARCRLILPRMSLVRYLLRVLRSP